jgi:hypothetical protein
VSSLAFADDLNLTAAETSHAENLLRRTEKYLEELGMNISAHKCTAVSIRTTRDSWYLKDPNLTSKDGCKLLMVPANATIRYLGGTFSPWKGLTNEGLEREFEDTL